MVESIVQSILSLLSGLGNIPFGREISVFLISLMPILELRGGLIAAALLDVNPVASYIISIIGNIIPVPFILWFINRILDWMRKGKRLSKIAKWLDKKVERTNRKIWFLGTSILCRNPSSRNWSMDRMFNRICLRNG